MRHIKSVQVHDEHHAHWVVNTPLDQSIEWDAVIVDDQPNHLIAWTPADDAEVAHSGFVRFQPATGDRGTEVKVVMEYELPGGAMAAAIAKLFGEAPELMQQEARNAAAGEGPNGAGGSGASSEAEDYAPSNSEPEATVLPTANSLRRS